LQQTPSTQYVLAHSVPSVHPCAIFFLQAPLASQVLAPVQLSGSSPLRTVVHVPGVALQVWHVWLHAVSQQYESAQLRVAQSPGSVQLAPIAAPDVAKRPRTRSVPKLLPWSKRV
jgi:hypothetical protein